MIRSILSLLSFTFIIYSCSSPRTVQAPLIDDIRDLPELVVTGSRNSDGENVAQNPFRATPTRYFDLIHTELDLAFDWEKQWVLGKANLIITPLAQPQDSIVLDAVGFLIHDVQNKVQKQPLKYHYNQTHLTIFLPRTARLGDTLSIFIDYTARPDEMPVGGSQAIQSDKGLYFINPTGTFRDKPTQIWTQGETQSNSRWFPTFDQPNERCTQEIRLTVDSIYQTLSNGLLVDQQWPGKGKRIDTWKMDLPHAPYLFMLAIGEYSVSADEWQGIPLTYYVEPEFSSYAQSIFPDAPAMLSFFSDYTGVMYPWPKYSQVAVRDFVSGAMENTTAVIYGEFMQATDRELIDERRNELIGAHELIHHWFGDLVTCESWSNLVLNEGFANYGEYLWLESKYGTDEAEFHRINELNGYLMQAQDYKHPLVDYHYNNREDMFDAHSYNKGGLVLHMLRHELTEPVFKKGIRRYLQRNAYQAVEVADLRIAMEEVSGRDLQWFFEQWFFEPGHPVLEANWNYDSTTQKLTLIVNQTQDPGQNATQYIIPTEVAVLLTRDKVMTWPLTLDARQDTFIFQLDEEPVLVDLDPRRIILAEQNYTWTNEQKIAYWRTTPTLWTRLEILTSLEEEAIALEPYPYQDPHWSVRANGIGSMGTPERQLILADIARNDFHSEVRAAALSMLAMVGFPAIASLAQNRLENDRAYNVIQVALNTLYQVNPEKALQLLKQKIVDSDSSNTGILIAAGFLAEHGTENGLVFFEKNWHKVNGYARMPFIKYYVDLLKTLDLDQIGAGINLLGEEALASHWTPIRRLSAFRGLAILKLSIQESHPEMMDALQGMMDHIQENEADPKLRAYYENY